MAVTRVVALDAAGYRRHVLHGESAVWAEKNCYADLWIELVHALGGDPHAMLPVTLPLDFEGDQWTFFKPSHEALFRLYGLDVQELTVWRPLIDHAVEHLGAGKWIAVETDAFWLPDTAGTDYRRQHTKTTIVLNDLDVAGRRLGYFHNAGYYELAGEDFTETFRLDRPHDPAYLPLFAELIRIDRFVVRPAPALRALAAADLRAQLARRPLRNPVRAYAERFTADLPMMRERGLDHYHAWAFATTRQLGAAFELAARLCDWLVPDQPDTAPLAVAARAFDTISTTCKALILKGARAVSSGRTADLQTQLDTLVRAWDEGYAALANAGFVTD